MVPAMALATAVRQECQHTEQSVKSGNIGHLQCNQAREQFNVLKIIHATLSSTKMTVLAKYPYSHIIIGNREAIYIRLSFQAFFTIFG